MKNQQRLADKKEEQTLERTSKEKKEIFLRMRDSYKRFVKTWIRFANPWIRIDS